MATDMSDYQVVLRLEAYMLWLFGWVLFTSTHGNSVNARLIQFAWADLLCRRRGCTLIELGSNYVVLYVPCPL